MAVLINAASAAASGTTDMTGPCSVQVSGLKGGIVKLSASTSDQPAVFEPIDARLSSIVDNGWYTVDLVGTYTLKAESSDPVHGQSSVTVIAQQ